MPTKVTRKGKTYYEYSPQELEDIRNERLANYYERNGQHKFAQNPFTQTNGKTIGKHHHTIHTS